RTVAVKTFRPATADPPSVRAMFLDDARVAARLHHPHVAEILDFGEQDGVVYLVREWIDGQSLAAVCNAARSIGTIPLHVALCIASQTWAGLHAAHELQDDAGAPTELLHRDLTPANVIISTLGVVKVTDFGLATLKARTQTGEQAAVHGKTPYLSPEQLRGGV